jgi:hypothetical protein
MAQSEFVDVEKQCKEEDCKKTFVLTSGEQDFYTRKGLHLPARCPDCRQKKKNRENGPFSSLKGKEFADGSQNIGVAGEGQE